MKTLIAIAAAGLIAAPGALADGAAVDWPDCYCTDKSGTRHEMGALVCMVVDGREFTARCEMALNNPFWREQTEGCLVS